MPMENKRKALEVVLRQIIQTDRQANGVIQRASEECKSMAEQTELDKAAILQDAEDKRQEMIKIVQDEQAEELEKRKAEAKRQVSEQQQALQQKVSANKDAWVRDITARILAE